MPTKYSDHVKYNERHSLNNRGDRYRHRKIKKTVKIGKSHRKNQQDATA